MATIKNLILAELENNDDEIFGTENIAQRLLANNHAWVRRVLDLLEQDGELEIIRTRGGRGHKNIIRRNRNSPGYPRKVR